MKRPASATCRCRCQGARYSPTRSSRPSACLAEEQGSLRRLVRRAARLGVRIAIENLAPDYPGLPESREIAEPVEPVLERVILFHVHDNLGTGDLVPRSGGIEPVCLDLHLPPGAGRIPWATRTPLLASHPAPLQLEIHPNLRLVPATLAILAEEMLGLRRKLAPV